MAEIRLEQVHKSFGRHEVISGIDLSVDEGEYCVLLGPSGCGKSTLLRLVAGLERVSAGTVYIGGRDVTRLPPKRRNVAMVFQSYALYPHMTVHENMAFGLRLDGCTRSEVAQRVRGTARSLHIETLLDRRPSELSGGQRQRVAIGRAIVREPSVFLLDEPLSNLDSDLRARTRVELSRLHRRLETTTIHVTHDQVEAMTLADRLVVIDAGRVIQSGPPLELFRRPRNLFVAGFLGSPRMNFLPARLQRIDPAVAAVTLPGGARILFRAERIPGAEGAEGTLGIRPEHLESGPGAKNRITGSVILVEHLGDHALAYVAWSDDTSPLVMRVAPDQAPALGETLSIGLPAEHCHFFGEDGEALLNR